MKANAKSSSVYGFNFDINPAGAVLIAGDKAACSSLLANANIPHVEHQLYLHPRLTRKASSVGSLAIVEKLAEASNYNVVCKPNQGASGIDVTRVQDRQSFESTLQQAYRFKTGISVSPFYHITAEYRLILLDGALLLAFKKSLPTLKGDGKSSIKELVEEANSSGALTETAYQLINASPDALLSRVLSKGEDYQPLWKHNLASGAYPFVLSKEETTPVIELAQNAAHAIGTRLAAVDLILTDNGWLVLEINSGIMLEHFAGINKEYAARAFNVYKAIVNAIFPNLR